MRRLSVAMLISLSTSLLAQSPQLRPGAVVYIEPMKGYETYLAAAFSKKHVLVTLVTDKTKADYILTSTVTQRHPPQEVENNTVQLGEGGNSGFNQAFMAGLASSASAGSTNASISVIDMRTSRLVFAYSVGKHGNGNQFQSTAEACAKHLKDALAKTK